MREIKFRAWDYGKKIFLPTKTYAVLNDKEFGAIGVMLSDFENYQQGEYLYPNSQVLNQFTGLKDKNGVDIYECDLIQHDAWNYPFKIIFNNERARFVCEMKTGLTQFIDNNSIVVIGNIYENPELLK